MFSCCLSDQTLRRHCILWCCLVLSLMSGCETSVTPMAGPASATGAKSLAKLQKIPLDVQSAVQSLQDDSAAARPADASLDSPVWLLVELDPEMLSACRSDLRDLRVEVEDPAKKSHSSSPRSRLKLAGLCGICHDPQWLH